MTLNSRHYCLALLIVMLAACTTTPQAPVIERTPVPKKPVSAQAAKKPVPEKDWRPDSYTVKKGDTLYSIGLEYGYDYKEIAQANNIQSPYIIRVGQQLALPNGIKPKPPLPAAAPSSDVVITPLKTEPIVTSSSPVAATATPAAGEAPLISEPKALREPYSVQAAAAPAKPAEPKQVEVPKSLDPSLKTTEPAKVDTATVVDDEAVDWSWPTNGKVIAGFNEASNAKGIDIGGTLGQAITASAAGKVIYSGSDLRGYGKLVIIKHNKTYLSVYAHNSQILVKEGQQVSKGQKIAEMGNTDTDRVKLHFEIRKLGKSVDPVKYLTAQPG